jgi:hypothetical protein
LTQFCNPICPGNRPEFSPHVTWASSQRGRKSDATCSSRPATTGKNRIRSANGSISLLIARATRHAGKFFKRLD